MQHSPIRWKYARNMAALGAGRRWKISGNSGKKRE
jgi:hypothetical protein